MSLPFARSSFLFFASSLALAVSPMAATAATIVLEDTGLNASMTIDTSVGNATNWTVEGINNLALRTYFIRVGAPAVGNPEIAVNDLNFNLAGGIPYDNDFFPGNEGLSTLYIDPSQRFRIVENTTLVPGLPGSNQSTFTESFKIDNLTQAPLTISIYSFNYYTLLNSPVNDAAAIVGPRALNQVYDGAVLETSVTVTPTHFQVGDAGTILASLTDGDSTILNDNPIASNGTLGFAFQWDFVIGAGKSVLLGSSTSVTVPEVSSTLMLSMATASLLGVGFVRRRR